MTAGILRRRPPGFLPRSCGRSSGPGSGRRRPTTAWTWCSIMRTVTPESRIERMSFIASDDLRRVQPPMTSSRQRTSGSVASARAISRRFSSPIVSVPRERVRHCGRAVSVRGSRRDPPAGVFAAAAAGAEVGADLRRSRATVIVAERADDLVRPHEPARDDRGRLGSAVDPISAEADRRRRSGGPRPPGTRRASSSGAVGPDDAEDLPAGDVEIDAAEREEPS